MATFLYVWAYPLVNTHSRRALVTSAPEPGRRGDILPVAPVNRLSMLTDYMAPAQRFVVCPNQDVVYGQMWMDLSGDNAVVVQIPDFGSRFHVFEMVDQRTDTFASPGTRTDAKPGHYLVVGPDWAAEAPAGIVEVLHSPTTLAAMFPRVFMDDTAQDRIAVQDVLNQIDAYPVAEFTGDFTVRDWKSSPSFAAGAGGATEIRWVNPETFWDILPTVLDESHPLPGEQAIYDTARQLISWASDDDDIADILRASAASADKEIVDDLFAFSHVGEPYGNGWWGEPKGARFGTDYFARTGVAKSYIFVNLPEDALYVAADHDIDGNPLHGAHRYTITFPAGQLPPVQGFWSLTAYDEYHFFELNELDRYSIGTKNKDLQLSPDGSLTLYLQADSPGPERDGNWLPLPKNSFGLLLRAYMPADSMIAKQYQVPGVVRQD